MNRKYIRVSNKDGKVWLMPTQHMQTGLELYQPSSKKGIMLKKWLPWVYWIKPIMNKLGIHSVKYVMNPAIHHVIEKAFNEKAVEYSVFEGTPCVHQKTTIQIFKKKNIIGYCKVTQNEELYEIFKHEQKLLGWLKAKSVEQIPVCPFCGETADGSFVFLQTTKKTLNSLVEHNFGNRQVEFLTMLRMKTSANLMYHDTDQYRTVCTLRVHEDLLDATQLVAIKEAIDIIENYYGNELHAFCAYHADFTPWNMFVNAGRLFVFDFEYGQYSYMPYLDMFHFLTQTAIFEKNMSTQQIFNAICGREKYLNDFFEQPYYAYLIYLVDVIARFVVRDGQSRTEDVNRLISIWFELMEMVVRKIKKGNR